MAEEFVEGGLLAYWYMCGVDGYDFRHSQADRVLNERILEWEEEENRRWESKLPLEEVFLIDMMRQEKEDGVLWECPKCDAEYRVKTPFRRLYCSECLTSLKCRRLLPKDHNKSSSTVRYIGG